MAIKFKLYSSDGYAGEKFEGGSGEWSMESLGSLHFAMKYHPEMCYYLEATGDELEMIAARFRNVPIVPANAITVWRKDWAQFIAENFKF